MAAILNEKRQASIVANENLRNLESERDKLRSAHRELLVRQADGSIAAEELPMLAAHERTAKSLDQRLAGARRLASEAEKELADALAEAERMKADAAGADGSRIHGRPPRPAGSFGFSEPGILDLPPVSAKAAAAAAKVFPGASTNRATVAEDLHLATLAALGSPAPFLDAVRGRMSASTGPGTISSNPDGGWSVSPEVGRAIYSRAFEQALVVRCGVPVYGMKSNELDVAALADHDESTGIAGLLAAWSPEASSSTAQALQLRRVHLTAHKLLVLASFSSELNEDSPSYAPAVERALGAAIAARLDAAFISGTGVGQPQGLTTSPAAVTVAKESGQAADTVVWRNIAKMLSRCHPGSLDRAVWLASSTTLPALLELSIAVGTGGSAVEAGLKESGGNYTLAGRPLYFSSRLPPLGDIGDLILLDPTSYALGIRAALAIEASPAPYFTTDTLAVRGRMRADGQCYWDRPVTGQDSVERSPIVILAARA